MVEAIEPAVWAMAVGDRAVAEMAASLSGALLIPLGLAHPIHILIRIPKVLTLIHIPTPPLPQTRPHHHRRHLLEDLQVPATMTPAKLGHGPFGTIAICPAAITHT